MTGRTWWKISVVFFPPPKSLKRLRVNCRAILGRVSSWNWKVSPFIFGLVAQKSGVHLCSLYKQRRSCRKGPSDADVVYSKLMARRVLSKDENCGDLQTTLTPKKSLGVQLFNRIRHMAPRVSRNCEKFWNFEKLCFWSICEDRAGLLEPELPLAEFTLH